MNWKRIGGLTSAIVVLSLIVQIVPGVVLGSLFDGAPVGWVPTVGTVGQTVVLYSHGIEIFGALTPICLGLLSGYLLSKRRSLDGEFRPFVRTVAVGAAIPAVLAWIALVGWTAVSSFDFYSVVLGTAMATNLFVSASIPVFVATLTGVVLSPSSHGVPPEHIDGETAADETAASVTPSE